MNQAMEVEKMSNLARLLVLALCMSQPLITNASWYNKRYIIHIENRLSNQTLQVHCKSGNRDLGFQHISLGEQFQWEFYTKFWVIFKSDYCTLLWSGGYLTFEAFYWPACEQWYFDGKDDLNCNWQARDRALYTLDPVTREYGYWKEWET